MRPETFQSPTLPINYTNSSVKLPSLVITGHVQVLQHNQHLVSMGTGSQAGWDPTALIGGIVLVPVRLHLIGSYFASVGAICVPAPGVLGLFWKLDMFDDHRGLIAAFQVQPEYLPITTPQCLELSTDTQGGSTTRLQDKILVLLFHLQSELKQSEEEAHTLCFSTGAYTARSCWDCCWWSLL